jgi:peptide/nickel transport system substrate-binding protein
MPTPESLPLHLRSARGIASLAAVLLLAGCGVGGGAVNAEGAEAVAESDRYGGTVIIGIANDPTTMNPLTSLDLITEAVQAHLLSTPLFRRNEQLEFIPWLAERWDTVRIAPDTIALTLHLRGDVRWHDGAPVTAADVLFTYQRMRDPQVGYPRGGLLRMWDPRAELLDSHTIRFRLRPHSDFLHVLQEGILPKHLLEDVPPGELRNHPFGISPVGSGPFRFVRYVRGQEWVFEANQDYPEALGGRPYLDRIILRVIPDQSARLTEIIAGGIDLAAVRASHAGRAAEYRNVRFLSHPDFRYSFIAWNNRLPLFADARVRRALSLGLDRQQLLDAVAFGYGETGRFTITPGHWPFDRTTDVAAVTYAPEEAMRLLDEAGWDARGSDGIRRNAAGRPFRFSLLSPYGNDEAMEMLTIVQAQLRRIGVDVVARVMDTGTMWDRVEGNLNADGERVRDYEALVETWSDYIRKDDYYILHSKSTNELSGLTGYGDPEADRLIDSLALTLDREVALPMWREYERRMLEDSPLTVLFYPQTVVAVRTPLQGVEADARGTWHSAARWWVMPADRRVIRGSAR